MVEEAKEERSASKMPQHIRGMKLFLDNGKYYLAVHQKLTGSVLQDFVGAFQILLSRFGIEAEVGYIEDTSTVGPAEPTVGNNKMSLLQSWFINPSSIDWISVKDKEIFHPITNFVYKYLRYGSLEYVSNTGYIGRSQMYINSAMNIICKLFLLDQKKFYEKVWCYIPRSFRETPRLKFHSLKAIRSVLATAEVTALPKQFESWEQLQLQILKDYYSLQGTNAQKKLDRINHGILELFGKPFLSMVYDRLRTRNSIKAELIKAKMHNTTVKLSAILLKGLKAKNLAFQIGVPNCAICRFNIAAEIAKTFEFPSEITLTPKGLPYECSSMQELLDYCSKNMDRSYDSSQDGPQVSYVDEISSFDLI